MELAGDSVSGLGGFELVVEGAQVGGFTIAGDTDVTFLGIVLGAVDADELGGGVFGFAPAVIPGVLPLGADAEVGPSVVQAVVVDVIDDHALRRLHDELVHVQAFAVVFAEGVKHVAGGGDTPFPLIQPSVISRIDDGVFSPCQADVADFIVGRRRRICPHDWVAAGAEVSTGAPGGHFDRTAGSLFAIDTHQRAGPTGGHIAQATANHELSKNTSATMAFGHGRFLIFVNMFVNRGAVS